jgi:hypothetical protein
MSDNFSLPLDELQSSRFPYLDAVIHETLRLANVGGVSARDGEGLGSRLNSPGLNFPLV